MAIQKDALRMLTAAVLSEELKGYTIQKSVHIHESIVDSVDVLAISEDQHTVFKRIYVFCESVERLVREEIESHVVFRDNLKKHVEFGPKDEYWVVTAGTIDAGCDSKGIVLKDWNWLSGKLRQYMSKSRKVREAVDTLQAAGVLKQF